MKFLLIATLLLLPGCYQMVNSYDMNEAEELCKDKGGVVEIQINFVGAEFVTCKTNETLRLHRIK